VLVVAASVQTFDFNPWEFTLACFTLASIQAFGLALLLQLLAADSSFLASWPSCFAFVTALLAFTHFSLILDHSCSSITSSIASEPSITSMPFTKDFAEVISSFLEVVEVTLEEFLVIRRVDFIQLLSSCSH